jgi:hypothetical protein
VVSTATSTVEWIGSGVLGASCALLVAIAARLGSDSAHKEADQEFAAYRAERERRQTPTAPAPDPFEFPPIPTSPPTEAVPADLQTLQLHEVRAHRARHRKEPTSCT